MKKEFKKPSLEVITFKNEDIITTSGGGGCSPQCQNVCIPNCEVVG